MAPQPESQPRDCYHTGFNNTGGVAWPIGVLDEPSNSAFWDVRQGWSC